jgi:hypothetical protein
VAFHIPNRLLLCFQKVASYSWSHCGSKSPSSSVLILHHRWQKSIIWTSWKFTVFFMPWLIVARGYTAFRLVQILISNLSGVFFGRSIVPPPTWCFLVQYLSACLDLLLLLCHLAIFFFSWKIIYILVTVFCQTTRNDSVLLIVFYT